MRPVAFAVTVGALEGALCFAGLSWMLSSGSFAWKYLPFILGVALPVGAFVGWQSFRSVRALISPGPSFLGTMAAGGTGGAFIGVVFILLMPLLAQERGASLSTLLTQLFFPWLAIGTVIGLIYAAITWLVNSVLVRLASKWLEQHHQGGAHIAAPLANRPTLILASVMLCGLVIATLVRQGWQEPEPVERASTQAVTVTTNPQGLQGAVREDGKEIIPHRFAYVSQIGLMFFLVRAVPEEGKIAPRYGVWSLDGQEVIPPRYQGIQFHAGHLRFRVSLGEASPKFGYLDKTGREIVPVIYDQLDRFSNLGAEPTVVARRGNGYGYVDVRSGEVLIKPVYEAIHVNEQMVDANGRGIVLARQQGKWGVLDTRGRPLTGFDHEELDAVDHETLQGRQGERTVRLRFRGSQLAP